MTTCPDCGASTTDLEGHIILEGHNPHAPIEHSDEVWNVEMDIFALFRFLAFAGRIDMSGIRVNAYWEENIH
jgi:hypothetical protein